MALRKFLFLNPDEGFTEEFKGGGADSLDAAGGQIVNLATPTLGTDAANKAYVDAFTTGLKPQVNCVVCPPTSWATFVAAGGPGVGKTLEAPTVASTYNTQDNVLLTMGQRVLVATAGGDLVTPDLDNGIYTVVALGNDSTTKFKVERATDFDQDAEVLSGSYAFVTSGDVNGGKGFTLITPNPITVDTTPLVFTQFNAASSYSFNQGLVNTGGAVKVELDTAADAQSAGAAGGNSGLEFDADTAAGKLRVAVGATGGINRATGGLIIEIDPLANTAGNAPSVATTATGLAVLHGAKVQDNYVANEAIAAGNPVAWAVGVNDKLAKGRADADAKARIIGVAVTAAGTLNDTVAVVSEGVAPGALTGLGFTAGDPVYLAAVGGYTTYAGIGSGKRIVRVGTAKNATDLFVDVIDYGKKAA